MKDAYFEALRHALNVEYGDLLPEKYWIYKVCEYDPSIHKAPNLWMEKRERPNAKYLAILTNGMSSVPALGETVNLAVKYCIMKIEQQNARENNNENAH